MITVLCKYIELPGNHLLFSRNGKQLTLLCLGDVRKQRLKNRKKVHKGNTGNIRRKDEKKNDGDKRKREIY